MRTDIRTGAYFPPMFNFLGGIVAFIGVLLLSPFLWAGLGLLVLSVIMLTTHYRFQVDPVSKTYFDYVWVLGFRKGDRSSLEHAQYFFLNHRRVRQQMNSRVSSSSIVKDEYNGYLRFPGKEPVHVLVDENKTRAADRMQKLASAAGIPYHDGTEGR